MAESLRDFKYEQHIVNVMPPRDDLGIVWHYTDAAGALGIIESGTLWATSAAMLNDTDEFQHGMRIVESVWADIGRTFENSEIIDNWLRLARSKLEYFQITDSYVVCASRVGDSFGQFKNYGPYALGLSSFTPLEKEVSRDAPAGVVPMRAAFELGWRRVLYDEEEKRRHAMKLIGELAELARVEARGHEDEAHMAALECVFRSVAYVKAREFEQEQEVRLCGQGLLTNARVLFRTSGYGIVPYIRIRTSSEFPNDRLPLTRLNLGPRIPYRESAEKGLRIALREHKLDPFMEIGHLRGTGR